MNPTWYIAKYMPDLRRREPKNIGILLFTDRGVETRFKGERGDTGTFDGRLVKGTFASLDNYKAWIAYWKVTAAANDIVGLRRRNPTDSYFVEFGGERVIGSETIEPAAFADQLFRDLVEDAPGTPETIATRRLIERTFDKLKIRERITDRPAVVGHLAGVDDPLTFDYRYQNGINVLMKRVHVVKDSWTTVHEAAWIIGQTRTIEPATRLVPLVSHAEDVDPSAPVTLLKGVGGHDAVDVSDEQKAMDGLAYVLGLTLGTVG